MAEVLFEAFLVRKGMREEWRVESAGVWAYEGSRATANAQKAMAERDLDLSQHLREIAGQEGDFADPVGGSLERYRAAADELEMMIKDSYERITAVIDKVG
jgi:protein-tyrosine-phosphatase